MQIKIMKEYHKIETIFKRDTNGSKKLIEGKFRNKAVEYLADSQWIFTEKVDGTNIRVHWDGHKVSFGGRTEKADIPKPLLERLKELFLGDINEQVFEQKFGSTKVTLYGEGYGGKIQAGADYKVNEDFILFDGVMGDMGDAFLSRGYLESLAKTFNIDIVPIVLTGTIQEAVDYVKRKPVSPIGKNKESEGLIGKPLVELKTATGERVIVKIKVRDF
jgi:hypothetical protein